MWYNLLRLSRDLRKLLVRKALEPEHSRSVYQQTHGLAAAATIIPLINDTVVFFAITLRLCSNSFARRTLKDGINLRLW